MEELGSCEIASLGTPEDCDVKLYEAEDCDVRIVVGSAWSITITSGVILQFVLGKERYNTHVKRIPTKKSVTLSEDISVH